MKRSVFFVAVAMLAGGVIGWLAHRSARGESSDEKPLVHVVLFTLKKDAPKTAADDLIRDAHAMLEKIPVVTAVHAGRRAPGDRDVHVKDYDVALDLHVKRAGDVNTYLKHPLHEQFAAKHGEHFERVRVCDFYSE